VTDRKHLIEMPPGDISDDGQVANFNFVSDDGQAFAFSVSTDALEAVLCNLEQLAISAMMKRLELGTDRGWAPKELPAFRSAGAGFVVEEAEPEDNFEGYRLLIFRGSRPPILIPLRPERFQEFLKALREAPIGKPQEETSH
jgi:hypothetical protein